METVMLFIVSAQNFIKEFSLAHKHIYPYLLFLAMLIPFICGCLILHFIIVKRFISWSKRVQSPVASLIAELFKGINLLFYFVLSLYLDSQISGIKGFLERALFVFFLLFCVFECVRILEKVILFLIHQYFSKNIESDQPESDRPVIGGWITILLKTILWTLALLFVLNNLGVKITALAASLGVTSIAVAFALQSILSDIFSSISIYLDRPFKENDLIVIGNDMGVVQKIGIKTTRLRTMQGEELIVSNHELTSVRIRNFKQMEKRRIVFTVGVMYSTQTDQVRAIPGYIKQIIEAQEMTEFDRSHFSKLADYALIFETAYYVTSGDYALYMDVQQAINLGIMEKFRDEGIGFAFPTQTIHLEK